VTPTDRARPPGGPARAGRRPRCRWARFPLYMPRRVRRARPRPPGAAPATRRRSAYRRPRASQLAPPPSSGCSRPACRVGSTASRAAPPSRSRVRARRRCRRGRGPARRRRPTARGRSDRWRAATAARSRPTHRRALGSRGASSSWAATRWVPGHGAARARSRRVMRPGGRRPRSPPSATPPTRPGPRPPQEGPSRATTSEEEDRLLVAVRRERPLSRPPSRARTARATGRGPGYRSARRAPRRWAPRSRRSWRAPRPRCGHAPSAARYRPWSRRRRHRVGSPQGSTCTLRTRAQPAGRPRGAWPPR
jgi:hypothetical protein